MEAAAAEHDQVPALGWPEVGRKNRRGLGEMASREDVLRLDVETEQKIPDGGGEAIHGFSVQIGIACSALGVLGRGAFLRSPPVFDCIVKQVGLGRCVHVGMAAI